jgi:esterase FrsA
MGYEYKIDAKAMFEDRFAEFVGLGIPKTEVAEMRSLITDMWADAPGGWVYEWSRLAQRHGEANEMFLASLAYGCAKFPCLANDARRVALQKQVEAYLAAAPEFPLKFERRLIDLAYKGAKTTVPIHFYSSAQQYDSQPILLFNGGVDTWKMDSHGICIALAQHLPITINGADDYFVPQADTLLFENRENCEVHLIPGTGHCAFSKLPEVMALIVRWLPAQIGLSTP